MTDEISIKAFHGTDYKFVNNIINEGFIFKINKEHWLGNGIYFFTDVELAKWWTKNPTEKYGERIEKPAIIVVDLKCESSHLFDMTKLETYRDIADAYNIYCKTSSGNKLNIKLDEFRCNFFDWLFDQYIIDAVKACFEKYKPSYFNENSRRLKENFCIPYPEIQICVHNKEIIKNKHHYKG